jgi:hypothetical protein
MIPNIRTNFDPHTKPLTEVRKQASETTTNGELGPNSQPISTHSATYIAGEITKERSND